MKRLNEVLENRGNNYILPFFWQHGESEEKLREYMKAIHNCGIGAVCCECRPHPDFCGPQWWHDMDIILDEAKRRDMKVWILDDAHFPTGQANGRMIDAPSELCKQFLDYHEIEIAGPIPEITLNIAELAKYEKAEAQCNEDPQERKITRRYFADDELVAVVAVEGLDNGMDGTSLVDLTDMVKNGILTWDVPSGFWRVMIIYKTRNGGGNAFYINLVSKESCRLQIDAVYEPHWEHYKDEFGKTIMGFFSDELQLGNIPGFEPDNWIGKKMQLSWSDEVETELKECWGTDYRKLLAGLWFHDYTGKLSAYARYHYMDVVTRAVERDISFQIGDWCEKHGVSYIGHSIEDNNEHARMGQSLAHHFRGLAGQHMAGIDDICNQVLIGGNKLKRNGGHTQQYGNPLDDGEFYHYMLGKLGSSHAHMDPRKKGDSMCEIFGAYGWSEGTRLMKYLVDHFLVRGINHYVPHAFSPKEFPDYDCPPHFYAHGLNPLYKGFGQLMRYVNRVCHMISGGSHVAPIAVLYHAEAEWMSREEGYMLTQKPLRVLMEHQIDSDIVWLDVLSQRNRYKTIMENTLKVADSEYQMLVIPYSYYITSDLESFILEARTKNFPIYFVGGRPEKIADKREKVLDKAIFDIPVISLDELSSVAEKYADIRLDKEYTELRYYHYYYESDIYLFSNESSSETFSGRVMLRGEGAPVLYDAMENQVYEVEWDGKSVYLTLPPYQTVMVVFGYQGKTYKKIQINEKKQVLSGSWSVVFKDALHQEKGFQNEIVIDNLRNMALDHPNFSGWVRYEKTFHLDKKESVVLFFEDAYETVEVFVNGLCVGMKICPPYQFEISNYVKEGENELVVEVATTLERAVNSIPVAPEVLRQQMFRNQVGYPFGLLGEASIYFK